MNHRRNEEVKTRNKTFHPVEKKGGCWGFFLNTGGVSRFIATGSRTKSDAIDMRETHIDVAKMKDGEQIPY
jgi:hypothetical protein